MKKIQLLSDFIIKNLSPLNKSPIESFLIGLTLKMTSYLNHIADNNLYVDEKRGICFSVAFELSIFDEFLDNLVDYERKGHRFVDSVGPAVEIWLQHIMNENNRLMMICLEKEDWKTSEVFNINKIFYIGCLI